MRKRMINPSIWTNRKILRCNNYEKLLFIGIVSIADDYGKLWYDLLSLKAALFPCDNLSENDLANFIKKLHDLKLIITDEKVIKIHGWKNHQFVPKPQNSVIPDPLLNHYSKSTVKLQSYDSDDTVSRQYVDCNGTVSEKLGESNGTVSVNLGESGVPTKERKKERKKESDETFSSESLEELSEKEKSLNNTKDLLLKYVYLFSNDEYNEINKLIADFKPLQAQGKIYEKLEKVNSPPN